MDDTNRPAIERLFRVSQRRAMDVILVALLSIHATLLAWQAWRYSPTIDEPAHLAAGISHLKFGRFELYRVNPPLVRLVAGLPMLLVDPKIDWSGFREAPYARPEFTLGTAFANANGFQTFWHFTLARWACIPFSLIGGYVCYRWARDLYGPGSGIVALTLWCFCPSILGNGALITPDVPAAAFGVLAGYFFWRWLSAGGFLRNPHSVVLDVHPSQRSPRNAAWPRALLAGLALGLAELTKSIWILLFALWPALWLIWKVFSRHSQSSSLSASAAVKNPKSEIRNPKFSQLTAILLIALYILNFGYGFENSFQQLGKFQFISRALGGPDAHKTPGNRFANIWLAALPVPVPANYLRGLDVQRYELEVGKWSYLRGEQKIGGWWYYYLYAIAVKTPLGTLLLISLAIAFSTARVINGARKPIDHAFGCASRLNDDLPFSILHSPSSIRDSVVLLAPAIALLVVLSSQIGFNRYLRYVVPAFPFLFIWTSQIARAITMQRTRPLTPTILLFPYFRSFTPQLLSSIVVVALLGSISSSLAVFPHSLSYFNELVGGPENGPAQLLDANIDWGQDLLELKRWYDAHPKVRPLHLAYFGLVTPRTAGVEFDSVFPRPSKKGPGSGASGAADPARGLRAGWYALSVNELYGYKHFGDRPDQYAGFRELRPVARAGYSIRIYQSP